MIKELNKKTAMDNISELNKEDLEKINGGGKYHVDIPGPTGSCHDGVKDWEEIYKEMTDKGLDPVHDRKEFDIALKNHHNFD